MAVAELYFWGIYSISVNLLDVKINNFVFMLFIQGKCNI